MTRHILVVDDEPDIREIAEFALARVSGWRVTTADGGSAAVAAASATSFDAILLDVMMPEVDGVETARLLRATPRSATTPIILLTAKSFGDDSLVNAPVTAIMAKPFDPLTLGDEMAAALGW